MDWDEYRRIYKDEMIAKGHHPITDEDGYLNMFVTDIGYHNGPGCSTCKWTNCWHCHGVEDIPKCNTPAVEDAKAKE